MIQQTIFPFKLELTKEVLTARSGLALFAEYNHAIGLRELVDKHLPSPGSNRGFKLVNSMVLMLQGGGRSFEDLRELKSDEGLMKLIEHSSITLRADRSKCSIFQNRCNSIQFIYWI